MTDFAQLDEKERMIALVTASQTGDRDAFGQLVEQFQGVVFAIALKRLRDYAEAQELCQDVFIQAMQKMDQLREPAAFPGWLRSITVRMAINRAVRRPPDIATEPDTLAATCVDRRTPLDMLIDGERAENLHEGLAQLRDLDRETLRAFYVEGQSLREMSDEFDAPIGTIKRRLHVARKRLAKEMEEQIAV
ncbi:sigma-70 family RNA polymerase sigma factor [Blastopirellula sp. JC732]|uniref:Sigma-70 family RNA polymerase sigma factor n=1 Tax=Blastopirellula sediminis TaxID=2894196 RepID=A0A9X1SEK3_9BACT|nr:sigma-70 family RNA polymerase sigma factor [Blastopirellula sediminis]MCC9604387.1 sigma-70 family RNA polymerase sigma factor [Blastopirellula sediminis]MCC9626907.1 sigma-70 family RNA polymerase sigma factor [Blastopirellula sediminis]